MKFPKSDSPAAMNLGASAVVVLAGMNLHDFAGLGRTNPVARAAMMIFLISLVGMAILNSVLSLAVYLQIVVPMYQVPKEAPTSARSVTAVWTIALAATVAVGLAAQLILGRISLGTRQWPPSPRAPRRT